MEQQDIKQMKTYTPNFEGYLVQASSSSIKDRKRFYSETIHIKAPSPFRRRDYAFYIT